MDMPWHRRQQPRRDTKDRLWMEGRREERVGHRKSGGMPWNRNRSEDNEDLLEITVQVGSIIYSCNLKVDLTIGIKVEWGHLWKDVIFIASWQ